MADNPSSTPQDTPAEAAARAWLKSYGVNTSSYTRDGGDHPAMRTLPQAFEAFAKARPASRPERPAPHLGRIGELAEQLRCAARAVTEDMVRSPGGDAYEYRGSTNNVEWMIDALNNLEHFQAGWK